MTRKTGTLALLPLLLLLFGAAAALAQPMPMSATYSEADNAFTITFNNTVRTVSGEVIMAGILVDDDNGGPFADLEMAGGTLLNSTNTGTSIRFTPVHGAVIGEYTYDDDGTDVERTVWGNDYSQVITLEDEMNHGSMRVYVPAGTAVAPNGALSQAAWVDLDYTAQDNLTVLETAHYDAATNVLSLSFSRMVQFDQIPEDIALESDEGDWVVAGNGTLDTGIEEDRNGNGVLDMEQNVVVAAITMSDDAGGVYTLVSALDLTNMDASTLELELSPSDRAAVEELDTGTLQINYGDYTFVDVDYNPVSPAADFPVGFTADSDPLTLLSASYDMGNNELSVNFDEPLGSAVRDHAVIPKLVVQHGSGDDLVEYALEAGEPGLANDDSTLIVTPGVGTAHSIENLIDSDPNGDFDLFVRRDAVRSAEGNGNLAGTVALEVIAEDDRNKAPEIDPDGVASYDAETNELFVPFDVRVDTEVELGGFRFSDGTNEHAIMDAAIDRANGNRALVLTLSPDDQHAVENVLDSDMLMLAIDPYSVKQQRVLNGNRAITIDPLNYVPDEHAPLVDYFFYDEQNDRYVVGANVTLHPDDVDLSLATVNGVALSAVEQREQAGPFRVYLYTTETVLEDLPLQNRTELSLDVQDGFLKNGDGVELMAQTALADGDTTENDMYEAVLTLGYGREFFVRSYEAFPTVPRKVAASLRRVSDGALWYVANDQWAPYDPYATREGKDKPHPVVTALRPAELDSAVAFFEETTPKVEGSGAREVINDVMAGDRASVLPERVNILFADIYDEFGLGRNDSKAGFWKHGYFLPSDLKGKATDEFSNEADLFIIDSYPQSFAPGDEAYTWNTSDEDWRSTDMAPMDRAGLPALANVYTQFVAYKVDQFEDRWVREGLAYLSEFLTWANPAFYGGGEATGLTGDNSLLFIGSDFKVRTDYKHVFMYYLYLWEKYGGNDFIRSIATSPRTGISGVREALELNHDNLAPWQQDHDVLDIYLDFATANMVDTSYANDNNRYMFENLNTQGAVRGKALKWKPTAGKDRPPYEETCPDWGFKYFFTGYGPFDPNPLLNPTSDDLIVFTEEAPDHLDFRKINMQATTVSGNMSAEPIQMQEVDVDQENQRDAVKMSPDGDAGDWVFGPLGDDSDATFPTWVLVAAGGGDFLLHHDASPADYSRLFISQNQVIGPMVDLYVISELPLYRTDGVSAPTVVVTSDEAGTDTLTVYDDPDVFIVDEVENSTGRYIQYVAHVQVNQTGEMYWHLGGYYSNGVEVDGGDPGMVVFSSFRDGEPGTIRLKDGARVTASAHSFPDGKQMAIIRSPEVADVASGRYLTIDEERRPLSASYNIGSAREKVADPLIVSLPYDVNATEGEDVGLYLLRDGRWDYVGGIVDEVAGQVTARVGQLGTYRVMAGPTGEVPSDLVIPTEYVLGANYPNPFNPSTRFQVQLPSTGRVTLAVYDVLGREVTRIHDGVLPYGSHTFQFDGTAHASGVYFLRMQAEGFSDASKLVLVK